MHVAVDARDLARDRRGIGRYVRAVLRRMVRRRDMRVTLLVRDAFPRLRRRSFARLLGVDAVDVAARPPRDADLIWHPWNGTFFDAAVRAAATIHDCAPFAFPSADARQRAHEQTPFRRTAESAARILVDSAFTRGEVMEHLGVQSERIVVVPLGVEPEFAPGGLDALPPPLRGRRYVLHVGAHDPHKNVATLIAAHAQAFAEDEAALVFTHPPVPGTRALWFDADAATLLTLYRGATLVAVPSLYEGFGLPVLEAMACGTSVLASRSASIPEVGGDTIRYVDAPTDVGAWSHALRTAFAAHDDDVAQRERARARAAGFTWERCVEATCAVLAEAAAGEVRAG